MFEFIALAGIGGAVATSRYWKARRRRIWQAVAASRDGGYRHDGAYHHIDYLDGDDFDIQMVTGSRESLVRAKKYTRGTAVLAHPPAPRFEICMEGTLASMAGVVAGALGSDKSVLGKHAGFDRAFTVVCPDGVGTRAMWTEWAMALMYEHFRNAVIRSDGERIVLEWPGYCASQKTLNAGLDLLREVRGRDVYGVQALQDLTGVACAPSGPGGQPRARLVTGAEVVLGPEARERRLVTVARLQAVPSGVPTIRVDIDDSGRISGPAQIVDQLPGSVLPQLSGIGRGALHIDAETCGETCYVWDDVQTDVGRLRAGANVLGELAIGDSDGAFR